MSTETTPRNNSSVFSEDLDSPFLSVEPPAEPFSLRPSLRSRPATLRDRIRGAVGWLKAWIVPPNVLMEPPPAFSELAGYATRGAWTRSRDGFLRGLAKLWLVVVALPAIVWLRLKEWVITRPSRALLAVVVWQLLIRSEPGAWLSDHVIRPYFHVLSWIFLS